MHLNIDETDRLPAARNFHALRHRARSTMPAGGRLTFLGTEPA